MTTIDKASELHKAWFDDSPESARKCNDFLYDLLMQTIMEEKDVLSRLRVGRPVDLALPAHGDQEQRRVNQIFYESFEGDPKGVTQKDPNALIVQVELTTGRLRHLLAASIVRGRSLYRHGSITSMLEVEEVGLTGLTHWAEIVNDREPVESLSVNTKGRPITSQLLNDTIRSMWLSVNADYDRGDWCLIMHPSLTDIYKLDVEFSTARGALAQGVFRSKIGKEFLIIRDMQYPPDGSLMIANLDAAEYGFFQGDTPHKKEIPYSGRFPHFMIAFQAWGLTIKNPRQNMARIPTLPEEDAR